MTRNPYLAPVANKNIGNYDADIRNTLLAFSKPVDGHHMGDSLFLCAAEDSLSWIATCRPQDCQDNGTNENDTCIGNSEEGDVRVSSP